MKSKIIAIAGLSGAGKSTVAISLLDKYPEKFALVHLDDYFKKKIEIPTLFGMTNWDDPDAIDFEKMLGDLNQLITGHSINIRTKSEKYNPQYHVTDTKINYTIEPKPIIILEGYLSIWNQTIRNIVEKSFFLTIDPAISIARKTKTKNPEYEEKILIPMFKKHVKPTQQFADYIIDVSILTKQEVLEEIESYLKSTKILA